jgi:TetR/AcrR family transcriptional regulator
MEEVAEAAEVSKGTLYLYFSSKTELAMGVYQRGLQIIVRNVSREISKPGTGIEMIQRMAAIFFEFTENHAKYYSLFLYFESLGIDMMKEVVDTPVMKACDELGDEMFHYIVRAVQIGIQDGSVDASFKPHEIAFQIMGAVRGLAQLVYFHEKKIFLSESMQIQDIKASDMIDGYMKMLIRALKPQ